METLERFMGKDNLTISRIILGALGAPTGLSLAIIMTSRRRNESWKGVLNCALGLPAGYLIGYYWPVTFPILIYLYNFYL